MTATRLRPLPGGPVQIAIPVTGKYGCTTQTYQASTGTYAMSPKGSVVLQPGGKDQYLGFSQPSAGHYAVNQVSRSVTFQGGHLSGGEATPMVGRTGQLYLTAPHINERWVCKVVR